MGNRGVPSRALAWASVAVLGLAAAGGCGLVVGDTIPAFECVVGSNTCPAGEMCSTATRTCVPLSDACVGACAAVGGDGSVIDASPPPPNDDAAVDAPIAGDDSSPSDTGVHAEGSVDATTLDGPTGGDDDDAMADATSVVADGPSDAGTDADAAGAADAEADAPFDGGGPCQGLLCPCTGSADCTSGICAEESAVTQDLYEQAGNANFCTQPCCSSADCGPSTVCFGTGAGANYCVSPAWLSRSSALGALAGGATCTANADCRSGLCSGGACVDTCCSTAQASTACASGATCNLGTFPGAGAFDSHRTGFCNANTGACGFSPCTACRTLSDCSLLGEVCSYAPAAVGSTDIVATCELAAAGTGAQGTACTTGSTCASGYCDSTSQQCSDVCFTNADCKAGWRCRNELVPIQTGGGNYYVLRCGN
jgi:hypothetical protein